MSNYARDKKARGRTRKVPWVLILLAALCAAPGFAQISPGPLADPHKSLDSITKCTSCHSVGAGGPQFKCLDCHEGISRELASKRGYHGKIVDAAKKAQDCVRCHTDHAGRDFALIKWPKTRDEFDHRETGYNLEGKHSGLACEKCHKPQFEDQALLKTLKIDNPSRTYFGLSTQCKNCHEDIHRGQLGTECTGCHTMNGWKPASSFNHATAKYPLTGAHQKVECEKCHKTIDAPAPHVQYTGLAFGKCDDCHKDPHRGAFAGTCQSCHTTDSWKGGMKLSGFDHGKTKFPLLGKHAPVACAKCHSTSDFKKPVAHALCMDCHRKDDPHKGQFDKRVDKGECAACHNEKGFKPSLFDVAAHQKLEYKLVGKHDQVVCEKCHAAVNKVVQYRMTHGACKDCHADAHAKQFAAAPNFDRCENCHTEHGFKPTTFLFVAHQKSRFPLTGPHGAIVCSDCHKPVETVQATNLKSNLQFHWDDLNCTGCHKDPHSDQLASSNPARKGKPGWDCTDCHVDSTWKIETLAQRKFDHAKTEFKLEAKHRLLSCSECHRPADVEQGMKTVTFSTAQKTCEGCHEDPHGAQFDKPGAPTRCLDCHAEEKWKPSKFDHFSPNTFSLAGAHQAVRCIECHSQTKLVGEKKVVLYHGTPSKCEACHANEPEKLTPR